MPLNVVFSDNLHGFLLAESSEGYTKTHIYRTTNGGQSWTHISNKLLNIYFSNEFIGKPIYYGLSGTIIIEYQGGTAISQDTGRSWELRPLKKAGREETAMIIDPGHIVVLGGDPLRGNNPQLLMSNDTGKNFQYIGLPDSTFQTTVSACIQDSTNVWYGSYIHGEKLMHLHHTTDAGQTWKEVFPVADTSLLGKFSFVIIKGVSKNSIYLASYGSIEILGQSYDFLATTDDGITWGGSWSNNGNILYNGILNPVLQNSNGKELWCVLSDHHTIGYSSNNGTNWIYDSVTFKNDSLVDMIWRDSSTGYIFGYRDSTITLYTHSEHNSVHYIVNYLNAPFKISPSITSDLIHLIPLHPLNGEIFIQDMLGRTILHEHLNVDEGTPVEYSLSHFASGVYYVGYYSGDFVVFFKIIKM